MLADRVSSMPENSGANDGLPAIPPMMASLESIVLTAGQAKLTCMATTHAAIISDPEVMDGLPVIRGTRIPVYLILELLEAGLTIEQIRVEYPHLSREQVQAAARYACELASR